MGLLFVNRSDTAARLPSATSSEINTATRPTRLSSYTSTYNHTVVHNSNYTRAVSNHTATSNTIAMSSNFTSIPTTTNITTITASANANAATFKRTTAAVATAMTTTVMTSLCENGSALLCPCKESPPGNQTARGVLSQEGSLDALLYIVVVLLFYAFSIVVLMVKYIRRENKEAYLRQYFDDYVARDHFQSAQARNQICLQTLMDRNADCDLNNYIKLDMANPAAQQGGEGEPDPPVRAEMNVLLSIPETVTEVLEEDQYDDDDDEEEEEVEEFESAEDELALEERSQTTTSVRTETDRVSSWEELRASTTQNH